MGMYFPGYVIGSTLTSCFAVVIKYLGKYLTICLILSCAKEAIYKGQNSIFIFQRFAVSLLHFRLIVTAKDLKIGFSINILLSLPNMGSSASALPFCLDCKRSVVSHFRSAFIPKDVNALLFCLGCQRSDPQFRCRFILCFSTQFCAILHEGLALQRDEASLFASKNLNHLIHT